MMFLQKRYSLATVTKPHKQFWTIGQIMVAMDRNTDYLYMITWVSNHYESTGEQYSLDFLKHL